MSGPVKMSYQEVMNIVSDFNTNKAADIITQYNDIGIDVSEMKQTFDMLDGTNYKLLKNADGSIRSASYTYKGVADSAAKEAASTVNSNAAAASTKLSMPVKAAESASTPGKVAFSNGLSTAGNFIFKEVVPAVAAAGVGISLGKTIDSALYNANPDFWDSHGMSSLNPETWASITAGDDSLGADLFNLVFGLDPETGKTQAYLDQDAFAYLTAYMQQKGVFDGSPIQEVTDKTIEDVTFEGTITKYRGTLQFDWGIQGSVDWQWYGSYSYAHGEEGYYATLVIHSAGQSPITPSEVFYTIAHFSDKTEVIMATSDAAMSEVAGKGIWNSITPTSVPPRTNDITPSATSANVHTYTFNDQTVYYMIVELPDLVTPVFSGETVTENNSDTADMLAWLMVFGAAAVQPSIPGIGDQEGGITPDLSNVTTVEEVLQALRIQFPDLFSNAVTQTTIQEDGTDKEYIYVPIGFPDIKSLTDTQPLAQTATQAQPEVDPETSPQSLVKSLVDVITDLIDINPPINGIGITPPIVIPSGTGSALYSIYNPSLSQINALGAWLWSSDFVDQLLKLFNNPMQAIIGLHKIFATPSISGSGTIKVGYLDSGVSSNLVGGQYTTINCGTVSLNEEYNNIFDYNPYTRVSLYLPFIGIVNLDAGEVMRGKITVKYSVDVLSGACLAEVSVSRDGGGGVLYTYSGDCKVTYPISSGSYMGIVSSIAGIAGGIVSTIASGGAALPMAMGAVGGALNARTNVQHSGSISGNAGAMGAKKPYLIVTRPQTNVAKNAAHMQGIGANNFRQLSSCSGFVKVSDIYISGFSATSSEIDEIKQLLRNGVIV